jgi:hypothetical protein
MVYDMPCKDEKSSGGRTSCQQNQVFTRSKCKAALLRMFQLPETTVQAHRTGTPGSTPQGRSSHRSAAPKPTPAPAPKPTPAPKPAKKTVDELAREVIAGKWSAGESRRKLLTAAGYDYNAVQARVNQLMPS